MFSKITLAVTLGACVLVSGCATIVHNSPRNIQVASAPPGAKVSIYDRTDTMISTHTTPFVTNLTTKYKYFSGQTYRLVFEMEGYTSAEVQLKSTVSGWYFGNLVFGGLLGMLVIDPITGAMYNLTPDKIEQPLTAKQASLIKNGNAFMVILALQATEHELANMIRVN